MHGHNNLYVGANIPLKDVAAICNTAKVACLYSHLTSASERFPLERFLTQLPLKVPKIPAVLSGSLLERYTKAIPQNIHFVRSIPETLNAVNSILFKI